MAAYDIFLKNVHSDRMAQMMIQNNKRLLAYLCKEYFKTKKCLKVLEVGPGKGYFKDAILGGEDKKKFEYYAVDRNENILKNLKLEEQYTEVAELPNIKMKRKFDIIFCGYVIEHLNSGIALYDAIANLKQLLKDDGILVLLFPDSMKLGMEFYNIDYTHSFPTTKRNVNQAVMDNSMYVKKAIDLCGILYTRKVDSIVRYCVKSGMMHFYSYRLMNLLAKVVYHIPIWSLENVFWRVYGLLKEANVMFIVKKSD